MPKLKVPANANDAATFIEDKVKSLFGIATPLLQLHANNQWLIYSPYLSNQVAKSADASSAFQAVRTATFGFELIRLMSLWDRSSPDRNSIPSIFDVMGRPDVMAIVRTRYVDGFTALGVSPQLLADREQDYEAALARLHRLIPAVERSARLQSLRGHRDQFIAHNLIIPARGVAPKYGQETRLLNLTVRIIFDIGLVVTNSTMALDATRRMVKRHADALWSETTLTDERVKHPLLKKTAEIDSL